MTRLDQFIREQRIKRIALARAAGITRQHLLRLRKGSAEPTRALMVRLALAAGEMLRRRVFVVEMFELTESEYAAYSLLIVARFILGTMPLPPSPPPTGVSSANER